MRLRIDSSKRRNAYADNIGNVIPVEFSEEKRIQISAEPFKWHVPYAIWLIFVAFRHGYLE